MSGSPIYLQCSNPTCLHPVNPIGQSVCERCQVPLVYRHLWAIGEGVRQIPVNTVVGERYLVKAPQIWLDTNPGTVPDVPDVLPGRILPYLHLYPHRLHVPELHGVCPFGERSIALLLDNVPIDETGELLPSLESVWNTVSPVRQVYWLWQLLQLWEPLNGYGVALSLLMPENLRVEGWRVRLKQLLRNRQELETPLAIYREDLNEESPPTLPPAFPPPDPAATPPRDLKAQTFMLKDLAEVWLPWVEQAHATVKAPLRAICDAMQTAAETELGLQSIAVQLNHLLLEQSAQLPIRINVAGKTDTGPQRSHNEDACYPDIRYPEQARDTLLPRVGIICDGIGGHEGGEVASRRALEDLKRLTQHLLDDFQKQTEPTLPSEVAEQLESRVRVVNNVIAKQNDAQGRAMRQRMGTTLVMAVQLPQQVETPSGVRSAHELYLVHVGDSRAYWLTPNYCHLLTLDDDVATREVRLGRSVYQEALERPDGGALTQALGTRDADALQPTVQRFMIEEDGLLLLCSDGLSDNDRVEQAWEQLIPPIFNDKLSLEDAVQAWIDLANDRNGHDNTSVVLMRFAVNPSPKLPDPEPVTTPQSSAPPDPVPPNPEPPEAPGPESELTEASRALLYDEDEPTPAAPPFGPFADRSSDASTPPQRPWLLGAIVALIAGLLGFFLWSLLNSTEAPPDGGSVPPLPQETLVPPSPTLESPSPEIPVLESPPPASPSPAAPAPESPSPAAPSP